MENVCIFSGILMAFFQRVLEWAISFVKRIRYIWLPRKAVDAERNVVINNINNIIMINSTIINQATRQTLGGQSQGRGRK